MHGLPIPPPPKCSVSTTSPPSPFSSISLFMHGLVRQEESRAEAYQEGDVFVDSRATGSGVLKAVAMNSMLYLLWEQACVIFRLVTQTLRHH
jgi:hypothetical protein